MEKRAAMNSVIGVAFAPLKACMEYRVIQKMISLYQQGVVERRKQRWGIKAGTKAVYNALNLDAGGSSSSSSLNMLTAPLVMSLERNQMAKQRVK